MRPETQRFELLQTRPQITGIRIGWIVKLERSGKVLVDFPGNPVGPSIARRTATATPERLRMAFESQRGVLLVFQTNDPALPIIFDVEESEAIVQLPTRNARAPIKHAPCFESIGKAEDATEGFRAVIGRIVSVRDGVLSIDYEGNDAGPQVAKTTVALRNLKDEVLFVLLPDGQPVVVGQLYTSAVLEAKAGADAEVRLKGSRVIIEADNELILMSGTCKIQLDARGKAVTTANQIVSRARATNKVQGGCVQIN